jgi:hypothetical protein
MSTVGSFDHCPGVWLGLVTDGLDGGVASMRKGPRCVPPLQLPALSRVRRWNHHCPSANGALVVVDPDVSLTMSGTVEACCDHWIE